MPRYNIVGTIHMSQGFDETIEAPNETSARARATAMAEFWHGPDIQELCINSADLVPEPASPEPPPPVDETTALLERLLRVAKRQGTWFTCDEGKDVGTDPDKAPAGYYDTECPPYAPGDLIPVYWDEDPAATPYARLDEVKQMLRDLLQQRQAAKAP